MQLPIGPRRKWVMTGVAALVAIVAMVILASLPGQSNVVYGQTTPLTSTPTATSVPPTARPAATSTSINIDAILAAIPNRLPGATGAIVTSAGTSVTLPVPAGVAPASVQCLLVTESGQQIRLPTTVNANGTVSCVATTTGVVTLVAGATAAAPVTAPLPRTGDSGSDIALRGGIAAVILAAVGLGLRFYSRRMANRAQ